MTENGDEDKHIITAISVDEPNDYFDIATNDNAILDKQLKRMFDSDDDVRIVYFRITAKIFQYL